MEVVAVQRVLTVPGIIIFGWIQPVSPNIGPIGAGRSVRVAETNRTLMSSLWGYLAPQACANRRGSRSWSGRAGIPLVDTHARCVGPEREATCRYAGEPDP